jgi:membrane fusion protein, heavy metal efflux system
MRLWICWVAVSLGAAMSARAAPPVACLIEPSRVAEVGSPVVGVIATMLVDRGDSVRAGQPIAVLRNDVERAALGVAQARADAPAERSAAEAAHQFALARLERAHDLQNKQLISTQALEEAQTEEHVAREQLARALEQQKVWRRELTLAQQQLEQRTLLSPITGVIVERYLNAGERVEDRPVARIASIDPLRVEMILSTEYLGKVRVGDALSIQPELSGQAALTAKVTLIDKIIDAASNTFRVRATLANPDHTVPAGLRCRVDISPLERRIPPSAALPPVGRRRS